MITKLSLTNFKTRSGSFDLKAANVVHGANFSGKTAIAQAIQCLTLGYIPGVSKTSSGLKEFASAWPMRISADFGQLGSAEVAFERVKSSIKQTADATMREQIDEQTRVLFDPTLFFGLSDTARITKAIELVKAADLSPADVVNAIAAALKDAPDVQARWKARPNASTVNDVLTAADEFLKTEKKLMSDEKARMAKTAEGLTTLSVSDAEIAALPPLHEMQATERELRAKIERLVRSQAADDQRRAQIEDRNRSISRLKTEIAHLPEFRAEIAKAEARQAEIAPRHPELKRQIADLVAQEQKLRSEMKVNTAPAPTYEVTLWNDGPLPDDAPAGEYRTEGTLTITAEGLRNEVTTRWSKIEPAPSADAEESEQMRLCQLQDDLEDLVSRRTALETECRTVGNELNALASSISRTRGWIGAGEFAEKSLAELEARTSDAPMDAEGRAACDARLADARASLASITTSIATAQRYVSDKRRIDEAAAQRTKLEEKIELVTAAQKLVTAKKQEIVAASIDAPLAVANRLAAGILKGPLVFEEGELGMRVGQQFVSTKVFSGTETAIAIMGLTAGLAASSKLRVLILDEFGRLDVNNAVALVNNLRGLVTDGTIDQFIVIGPDNAELTARLGQCTDLNVIAA